MRTSTSASTNGSADYTLHSFIGTGFFSNDASRRENKLGVPLSASKVKNSAEILDLIIQINRVLKSVYQEIKGKPDHELGRFTILQQVSLEFREASEGLTGIKVFPSGGAEVREGKRVVTEGHDLHQLFVHVSKGGSASMLEVLSRVEEAISKYTSPHGDALRILSNSSPWQKFKWGKTGLKFKRGEIGLSLKFNCDLFETNRKDPQSAIKGAITITNRKGETTQRGMYFTKPSEVKDFFIELKNLGALPNTFGIFAVDSENVIFVEKPLGSLVQNPKREAFLLFPGPKNESPRNLQGFVEAVSKITDALK